ncbi:hypothetical protein L6R29_03615 [Myxococcota bacterium]|nr:hypothetical protein [Myxococcota bacterium]
MRIFCAWGQDGLQKEEPNKSRETLAFQVRDLSLVWGGSAPLYRQARLG